MLIDMRSYTCKPGMLQKHIELYKAFGKAPQSRALGEPVAWMTTETGNINQFVHLWAYKDAACLLYTSPSPRDQRGTRMPSSA